MLSRKLLKSPNFTFSQVQEGGWQPTFDPRYKNPKIPNSHFFRWGGWWPTSDAESKILKSQIHIFTGVGRGRVGGQLLILSQKMLKSQIHIFGGGDGWRPTFDAESRNAKKSQIQIFTGGRGGLKANFLC